LQVRMLIGRRYTRVAEQVRHGGAAFDNVAA
jgi:hypothetical protein